MIKPSGLTFEEEKAVLLLLAGAEICGVEIALNSIAFLYGSNGLDFARARLVEDKVA